jgi:hypothetical protein
MDKINFKLIGQKKILVKISTSLRDDFCGHLGISIFGKQYQGLTVGLVAVNKDFQG